MYKYSNENAVETNLLKSKNVIMKKILYYSFLFSLPMLLFTNCSDDDSEMEPEPDPIKLVYQDIVPKEFLDLIVANCPNVDMEEGNEPPEMLNNQSFLKSNYLSCTSMDGETEGSRYNSMNFKITNFNSETLTVTLETDDNVHKGKSEKAYLLGSGNKFSLYAKVVLTNSANETADFLYLVSGTVTDSGIKDAQFYLQSVRAENTVSFMPPGNFRGFLHDKDDNQNTVIEFE